MFRVSLLCLMLWVLPWRASAGEGGIATAHPLATAAAESILKQGGNAFDAAVAASAALAVVEPYGSGLGGGGFWLLHRAEDGFEVMLDGRETAPAAASRDMYLDDKGEVIPNASMNGPLAAGIPGVPAALDHLAKHYGKLPLKTSLQPAIRLAREGFPVDREMRRYMGFRLELLRQFPNTAEILLDKGDIPAEGQVLKQPDLAHTLQAIAEQGRDGFYKGKVAQQMVDTVKASGGIWSLDDLSGYQVKERQPVHSEYQGLKVTSAALPSSGGIVLGEILNMLSKWDLSKLDQAQQVHLLAETMRRAYRDRAEFLGDSDFVEVDQRRLLSAAYADELSAAIQLDKATPSASLKAVAAEGQKGMDTTHFSILDKQGNRVAATLSINYPFGSGFTAQGTGVLLNNEMDDFSIRPGTPNAYGLVGAEANAIAAGKRMLSSMTPTFLEDEQRLAIVGSPGGSRIITMVLQATLAFAEGKGAADMVNKPRIHHQYLPDSIQFEPQALSVQTQQQLQDLGHELSPKQQPWGNMQAVILDKRSGVVDAASDQRGIGQAVSIVY